MSKVLHVKLASVAAPLFIAAALSACSTGAQEKAARTADADCRPVAQEDPNAPEQQPSFSGQTRTCAMTSGTPVKVSVLTAGLEHPWAVEPLPNGSLLITERPGRMRVVTAEGRVNEPITGVPAVAAREQGGLLDVALSPTFASDRTIYWSYSEPRQGGNATSVARGVLSPDHRRLDDVTVIVRAMPTYDGSKHFGSRLVFGGDGMLYITLGERSDLPIRPQAQQMDSHMGKILRVRPDGSVPPDNPFVDGRGARPEIWTLGHRNVQAAAFDPQGQLWTVDHGARGGDELNLIRRGKNYGWPLVTFGIEYSGKPIPNAVTEKDGFDAPVYYWDPVIAPSGAQFYTGDAFPEWRGNLLVGSLVDESLVRVRIDGDRVTGEQRLLGDRGQRIRDVRQGPDGAIYVVTDEQDGELWRLTPGTISTQP